MRARDAPPAATRHLTATLVGLVLCAWIPLTSPITSGFERGLLDPGDSRFAVFVLEHDAAWFLGMGRERPIWSLGIFYPRVDSLLFSDTFFGQTPLWIPLRLLAGDPVVAYHLLLALLLALNFLVAHRWLARRESVEPAGALFGAILFAIGSPRVAHLFHLQLVGQFPLVLFVAAIAEALEPALRPTRTGQVALGLRIGFWWAALFYLSPYMAWFVALAAALAVAFSLLDAAARPALRRRIRDRPLVLLAAAAVAITLVLPVARRYSEAAKAVGVRPSEQATLLLIPPSAWLNQGPQSLVYGRASATLPVASHPFENELRLGVGGVTSALVLWGLWLGRRRPLVRWTALPVAALCLLLSRFGSVELWSRLRPWLPGAEAFRAMSRAGQLELLPAALGLALALSAPAVSRRRWLVALLGTIVVVEQWQLPRSFSHRRWLDRVETLEAALPRDCPSFFYSPLDRRVAVDVSQLDAMWASLRTGIPTINGYSGALPPNWPLFDHATTSSESERAVARNLQEWLARNEIDGTCWLRGTHVTRIGPTSEVPMLAIFGDDFESGDPSRWRRSADP